MPQFHFTQRCRSTSTLRVDDVVAFARLMQRALEVPEWIDGNDETVVLEREAVEAKLLASQPTPSEIERFGARFVVGSGGGGPFVMLMVAVGGDQWTPNFFSVDFAQAHKVPELHFFEDAIRLVHPFEGFISEQQNERDVAAPRRSGSDKLPAVLRWFHYFDSGEVELLGGREHCLQTPGFRVEEFSSGVLFQLTQETFDPDNPRHQEIQRLAMKHLGIA